MVKRCLAIILAAAVSAAAALGLILWFPEPLFPHFADTGRLRIYSDRPIPADAARRFASDVEQRFERSPLALTNRRYKFFVANDLWRHRLLWVGTSPFVGGFVLFPFAPRNVYLSAADFARNGLVTPTGHVSSPPRTLAYYGAHELAHLATGAKTGALRFVMMPDWVREGLADYVALGRTTALRTLYKAVETETRLTRLQHRHGYYAKERLLVTFYLEHERWSLDRLLATDIPQSAAQKAMRRTMAAAGGN